MLKSKIISVIALVWLTAACNRQPETTDSYGNPHVSPDIVTNPATAEGEVKKKLPEFNFKENNFDFGTLKEGEVATHEFEFTNSGNADLVISQANGSCGCTVPEYSKDPITPGKSGKIKVTFNSEGQPGQVSKTITVLANTIPSTKVLTISAEVLK